MIEIEEGGIIISGPMSIFLLTSLIFACNFVEIEYFDTLFLLCTDKVNYEEAKFNCNENESKLAQITSTAIRDFISSHVEQETYIGSFNSIFEHSSFSITPSGYLHSKII